MLTDLLIAGLLYDTLVKQVPSSKFNNISELHDFILKSYLLPIDMSSPLERLCQKFFRARTMETLVAPASTVETKILSVLNPDGR